MRNNLEMCVKSSNSCNIFNNFSVQSMHKLNVAYNNAFSNIMHHLPTYCSASLMFVVNRVPNRRFPRSMRSQGERPGCGSRQACRPRDAFNA